MHALPELQQRFCAAIMTPEASILADGNAMLDLLEGVPEQLGRRLNAYRRNVFANLGNALALSYPVCARIVGPAFFAEAARCHVLGHPSHSGDLNDYGAGFADFIAAYPHAGDLPYLADVARLEWRMQALALAADPPPVDATPFAALATTPPERYDDLYFQLDANHARLDSAWPLQQIWLVNQAHYDGEMAVDFSVGCRLLLWRPQGRVELAALGQGEAALLDALIAGMALAPAVAVALDADADFDLGAALQRWIAAGLLRGTYNKENHP